MTRIPLTDEQEARIQAGIASDPDNPELTDAQLAAAKPFAEVFPALADSIRRGRGRPKVDSPKVAVTLRLSADTIARYRELGGDDWRAAMSAALDAAAR